MFYWVMGYLLGSLSIFFWKSLPSLTIFLALLFIAAIAFYFSSKYWRSLAISLIAALLASIAIILHAQHILQWTLPKNLETKTVLVTGIINSIPEIKDDAASFEFLAQSLNGKAVSTRFRLSWYKFSPQTNIHSGERWQFSVRLKRPHGQLNPGGFDYETWLFSKKIRATGYIVKGPENHRLTAKLSLSNPITKVREYLQTKINIALAEQTTKGLITALIMGSQSAITPDQWQVMRATGTNHLLAIAGVHIGFVSGFMYVLVNFIWRRSRWMLLMPAPLASAIAALLMAVIYSCLAGFALPTQRALIMLATAMLGIFLRRELGVWNAYLLALAILLLLEPLVILSISFWLSFVAVAVILFANSGRIHPQGWWWKYGRLQWTISIGLIPLSLILFGQTSLISVFANLFAVPAVGFLVLPLCLLGALFLVIVPWLGQSLLVVAAKIMAGIWWVLTVMAHLSWAVWECPIPSMAVLFFLILAIALILAPRGFPAKSLGLCCVYP